jgi:hypothetical protein
MPGQPRIILGEVNTDPMWTGGDKIAEQLRGHYRWTTTIITAILDIALDKNLLLTVTP